MKNIFTFIVLSVSCSLLSQTGSAVEFKLSSSQGASGSLNINLSEFGSTTSFNMAIPQMPGGGIKTKSLTLKDKPDIVYMINDNNKTYTETKKSESSKDDNKTYAVKKLGEEKMNGYKCVHALVTEGNESHETWNTKDIPDFEKISTSYKSNNKLGSQKREDALKAAGCDGLPVKTIHKGNAREGDMTMELVKIEKKNFTKSDFEIPAGYTKGGMGDAMSMPGMKSQSEIMKMTPEERTKYMEELQKKYGGK